MINIIFLHNDHHVSAYLPSILSYKRITMLPNSFSQYRNISLEELSARLHKDYYQIIEILCKSITQQCEDLKSVNLSEESRIYVTLSKSHIPEVLKYIDHRWQVFGPYVTELIEKDVAGHDCANCSGKCGLQHNAKLLDLTLSIEEIKVTADRIRSILSQKSNIIDKEIKMLQNKISLLENLLNEAIYIEQTFLMPKVKNMQKTINATS